MRKRRSTHHGFQADRLHEAVDDLRKCVRTHLSSSDAVWISVHTPLPIVAHCLERRQSLVAAAPIVHVVLCTAGHFRQYLRSRIFARSVHVCSNSRPNRVDNVKGKCQDGCVGKGLEVLCNQRWGIGILFDEAEQASQSAHLLWR